MNTNLIVFIILIAQWIYLFWRYKSTFRFLFEELKVGKFGTKIEHKAFVLIAICFVLSVISLIVLYNRI